jgi:hypothetical protein
MASVFQADKYSKRTKGQNKLEHLSVASFQASLVFDRYLSMTMERNKLECLSIASFFRLV